MWFCMSSVHCHDCWPLITSKVRECWISAAAVCYRAQSASLIAQGSITRLWKWARVCLLALIGKDERRCFANIFTQHVTGMWQWNVTCLVSMQCISEGVYSSELLRNQLLHHDYIHMSDMLTHRHTHTLTHTQKQTEREKRYDQVPVC